MLKIASLLVLLSFLLVPRTSQAQDWAYVDSSPEAKCRSLTFYDDLNGVMIDRNAVAAYVTSDGGESFEMLDGGQHIWVGSQVGHFMRISAFFKLQRTVDGGDNWQEVPMPTDLLPNHLSADLVFDDVNNGIAFWFDVTANTLIVNETTDGGQSWSAVTTTQHSSDPNNNVVASSATDMYWFDSTAYTSNNAGRTWTQHASLGGSCSHFGTRSDDMAWCGTAGLTVDSGATFTQPDPAVEVGVRLQRAARGSATEILVALVDPNGAARILRSSDNGGSFDDDPLPAFFTEMGRRVREVCLAYPSPNVAYAWQGLDDDSKLLRWGTPSTGGGSPDAGSASSGPDAGNDSSEGGGGCSTSKQGAPPHWALIVVFAALFWRRQRSKSATT